MDPSRRRYAPDRAHHLKSNGASAFHGFSDYAKNNAAPLERGFGSSHQPSRSIAFLIKIFILDPEGHHFQSAAPHLLPSAASEPNANALAALPLELRDSLLQGASEGELGS